LPEVTVLLILSSLSLNNTAAIMYLFYSDLITQKLIHFFTLHLRIQKIEKPKVQN